MADQKVTIDGMDGLLRALGGLEKKIQTKVLRKSVREGAKFLRDRIVATAPLHTGDYRASIRVLAARDNRQKTIRAKHGVGAAVETDDWKARWLEFGNKRIPAQAIFSHAVVAEQAKIAYTVQRQLTLGVARIAKESESKV